MAVDFEFKTVSDFNSGVYNNMITAGEYLKAPYADILANELDGTPTLRHWFTSAVYYDYWWLEVFQDVGKNAVVAQTFTNNALTPWSSINYIRKVRVWPSYISYGGGIPKMRCHLYTTLNYYGQIVPDQKIMSSDPVSVPIGTTVLEFDFNERLFLQNIPTNIYALVFEWYEAGWARCRFNSYLSGTSYPYGGSLHTSIGDFWQEGDPHSVWTSTPWDDFKFEILGEDMIEYSEWTSPEIHKFASGVDEIELDVYHENVATPNYISYVQLLDPTTLAVLATYTTPITTESKVLVPSDFSPSLTLINQRFKLKIQQRAQNPIRFFGTDEIIIRGADWDQRITTTDEFGIFNGALWTDNSVIDYDSNPLRLDSGYGGFDSFAPYWGSWSDLQTHTPITMNSAFVGETPFVAVNQYQAQVIDVFTLDIPEDYTWYYIYGIQIYIRDFVNIAPPVPLKVGLYRVLPTILPLDTGLDPTHLIAEGTTFCYNQFTPEGFILNKMVYLQKGEQLVIVVSPVQPINFSQGVNIGVSTGDTFPGQRYDGRDFTGWDPQVGDMWFKLCGERIHSSLQQLLPELELPGGYVIDHVEYDVARAGSFTDGGGNTIVRSIRDNQVSDKDKGVLVARYFPSSTAPEILTNGTHSFTLETFPEHIDTFQRDTNWQYWVRTANHVTVWGSGDTNNEFGPAVDEFRAYWRFEAPQVSSVTISEGEIDVKKNTVPHFLFTKAMNQASVEAEFSITPPIAGTFQWDDDFNLKYILTPGTYFLPTTLYTIKITGDAERQDVLALYEPMTLDGDDNELTYGSPTDDYILTFTTEAWTPPSVASYYPNTGAAPYNTDEFFVQFSEAMNTGAFPTGNVKLWKNSIGGAPISITPGSWTQQSKRITYAINEQLEYDTTYVIEVEADGTPGSPVDQEGEYMQGDWSDSFTIQSPDPPNIQQIKDEWGVDIPPDGTGINHAMEWLSIWFNQEMDKIPTEGAVTVYEQTDPPTGQPGRSPLSVSFNSVLQPGEMELRGNFGNDLKYEHWYEVVVLSSPLGAYDKDGEALDGEFYGTLPSGDGTPGGKFEGFYFKTRAQSIPEIMSSIPGNGQTNVPYNQPTITIDFSEAMDPLTLTGNYSINPPVAHDPPTWDGLFEELTITMTGTFSYETTYEVIFTDDFRDAEGDRIPNGTKISFTIMVGPPQISYFLPPLTFAQINSKLELHFTKNMDRNSVETNISFIEDPLGTPIPKNLLNVDWIGNMVRWDIEGGLDYVKTYRIHLTDSAESSEGVQLDGDGDGFPGTDFIRDCVTTPEPPKVIDQYPENNQHGIPLDAKVTVEFSKDMNESIVESFTRFEGQLASTLGTLLWTTPNRVLEFTPTDPFIEMKWYIFEIERYATATDDSSLDGDGNGVALETTDDFVIEFKAKSSSKPRIVKIEPETAAGLNPDDEIHIYFSEAMDQSTFPPTVPTALTVEEIGTGALPYVLTWLGTTHLKIVPDSPWVYTKTIRVTVTDTVMDIEGETLVTTYVYDYVVSGRPVRIDIDLPKRWPQYRPFEGEFTLTAPSGTLNGFRRLQLSLRHQLEEWKTLTELTESEILYLSTIGAWHNIGNLGINNLGCAGVKWILLMISHLWYL